MQKGHRAKDSLRARRAVTPQEIQPVFCPARQVMTKDL